MRKICLVLSIFLLFLSVPAQAGDRNSPFLATGYNEDGIMHKVYGVLASSHLFDNTGFMVARTIEYEGNVFLQNKIDWRESIDGMIFTGTLYLIQKNFDSKTDKTTAVYRGTLAPR